MSASGSSGHADGKNESVILNTAITFYQDVPSSRPPIFSSFAASPALSRVAGCWEEAGGPAENPRRHGPERHPALERLHQLLMNASLPTVFQY